MSSHKLGLPLEYQQCPEYFDAHNVNDETEAKNRVIENILRKHDVETVLDMTCGTGSQVFHLVKNGFQVIGSDFSPALLKIARGRAVQENLDLTFIDGDIRDIKVGEFDAIITIFNAIGHLTKADFAKALQNIRRNLKSSGIYVFDIFNLSALSDAVIETFKMDIHKQVNGIQIHNMQYSELDRENGLLTSYDILEIFEKGDKPKIVKGKFSLQLYSAQELREILMQNGFETLNQYDMDSSFFDEKKSMSILIVARKM